MARPRHQNGWLTEHGNQLYGNYWRYVVDPVTGERKKKHASVALGMIGELKRWKAKEKLRGIIAEELGPRQSELRPDPKTTFAWFVENRYLPVREGRWRPATKNNTSYEIKRYIAEYFGERSLEEITPFELQVHLNKLAKEFSDSIVRHAFTNLKAIWRTARKMKFIVEDPAEDLLMPDRRSVKKPKIQPQMILDLIEAIPHPRDRALLAVGCFCGPRTSEDLGLTWKSYAGDHFVIYDTAYEGVLYEGKVKTEDSRARIPIPQRVRPYIEAWKRECPDTSPDALMFPTKGHRKNKGKQVPFRAKNFFKWRVWPYTDKLNIPHRLCTFQVFRRTLGTDLQKHGTMKDAQAIMRHKHIKTTAEVYMDQIPESVRNAIDARTEAIFAQRKKKAARKPPGATTRAPARTPRREGNGSPAEALVLQGGANATD
jgi:integrase